MFGRAVGGGGAAAAVEDGAFATASLVAVQGSAPYWARLGFAEAGELPGLVATYGDGAPYMTCALR